MSTSLSTPKGTKPGKLETLVTNAYVSAEYDRLEWFRRIMQGPSLVWSPEGLEILSLSSVIQSEGSTSTGEPAQQG